MKTVVEISSNTKIPAMAGMVISLTCLCCLLLIFVSGVGGAAPNPMFTVRFDAEGATEADYRRFITEIRTRLQNNEAPQTSHGLPVARRTNRGNPPMFAIDLRTRTGQTTLYLRADTVYFEGYRDSNGRLYELDAYNYRHQLQRRWTGSTFMGFRETYGAFSRAGGDLLQTLYGPGQMVQAINRMAQGRHNGQSVVTLVVMISEAVRFNSIFDTMGKLYASTQSARAPSWWERLVHLWSGLSQGLLYDDSEPVDFSIFGDIDVINVEEATAALGLILNPCGPWRGGRGGGGGAGPSAMKKTLNSPWSSVLNQCPGERSFRVVEPNDEDMCWEGVPMLEIFKLVIIDIDGENPGDLYGTVAVTHRAKTEYIFNRKRSDYQSVGPFMEAALTGPSSAVRALADFTVSIELWDKDADWSPDDEVAKGDVEWTMADDFANGYDTVIQDTVTGKSGSVQISYAVYQAAVEAKIRVVLINGDGEDPADIYGKIVARNSFSGSTETVLFNRNSGEDTPVRPWQDIPLRRSVVAAPINAYKFIVQMEIWDRDRDLSPDDEVAKGTVYITPRSTGETKNYVTGKFGSVLLIVTWNVPLF